MKIEKICHGEKAADFSALLKSNISFQVSTKIINFCFHFLPFRYPLPFTNFGWFQWINSEFNILINVPNPKNHSNAEYNLKVSCFHTFVILFNEFLRFILLFKIVICFSNIQIWKKTKWPFLIILITKRVSNCLSEFEIKVIHVGL